MNFCRVTIAAFALLFSAAAVPLQAQSAGRTEIPASLQPAVQGFYDWYVPLVHGEHGADAERLALDQKKSMFDPRLAQALRDDEDAEAKAGPDEGIVGIDGDPFLNSQDPDDKYVVGKIRREGDRYWVEVHSTRPGIDHKKPDVIAELVLKNGNWIFVNFHSPDGWNLLTTLRRLKRDRESAKAKALGKRRHPTGKSALR